LQLAYDPLEIAVEGLHEGRRGHIKRVQKGCHTGDYLLGKQRTTSSRNPGSKYLRRDSAGETWMDIHMPDRSLTIQLTGNPQDGGFQAIQPIDR
jgi:hypothetical protein